MVINATAREDLSARDNLSVRDNLPPFLYPFRVVISTFLTKVFLA